MKLRFYYINQLQSSKEPKFYDVKDMKHALNYTRKSLNNEDDFPTIQKIELYYTEESDIYKDQIPILIYRAAVYESFINDEGLIFLNLKNKLQDAYFHVDLYPDPIPNFNDYNERRDWERDTWDALTDGQYGDYNGQNIGDWMEANGF